MDSPRNGLLAVMGQAIEQAGASGAISWLVGSSSIFSSALR
jgi:hypothetical protein